MTGARVTYDAVARAYADRLGHELDGQPLDRALPHAFPELTGPGLIAVVGCGPGHVTRFLAERHPAVGGVDLSPRMAEVAREIRPEQAGEFPSRRCCLIARRDGG